MNVIAEYARACFKKNVSLHIRQTSVLTGIDIIPLQY